MATQESSTSNDSTTIISVAGSAVGSNSSAASSSQQLIKLRDANNKYKSLLKLAKERIQNQEDEVSTLKAQLESVNQKLLDYGATSNKNESPDGNKSGNSADEESAILVRVHQRIRVEEDNSQNDTNNTNEERNVIWALLEYEPPSSEDTTPITNTANNNNNTAISKRWTKWRKFSSESELSDFIFRDTGEPIVLPNYSLSPEQSFKLEQDAKQTVAFLTEEFRRYRVRAEVQRKQTDATLKALQGASLNTAQQKIEDEDLAQDVAQTRVDHAQLALLKKELKEQEAQWKEAYDAIVQENTILKSSGGEALLASQWRHRFEASEKEKQEYAIKVESMEHQLREISANNKYESKYRDLKESFRLYRKKAKEIFEAQQQQDGFNHHHHHILDSSSEDARMAYLRNLMVNYLCSEAHMRDPMETALKTVLKFTADDIAKVEKAKKASEAWF